ncbi:guanylate-binding protein 1-like [Trichomycterus rosablanca]|uniref:guanylate-binding protein 1-like n=1 Tax=Trichomycterus rosablanca TaxID=2290929 RepID=UPI002F358362
MSQIMREPVCLISSDAAGQLCVMKEAKSILDEITQPVVVVSVVGLYRTGKSYLMNRLAGQQTGFALGSTIQSKTKGIWMWCIEHPCRDGQTLVLLDTEGLGDIEKGDEKHDTWIFCLAVLLSSTLVYNSLGVIDNTALEKLHYVTELTENIRVKAQVGSDDDSSTELMRVFPSFIWTVRDFTLELERDGQSITADEYLEGALVLKPGSSPKTENFNLPRRCLRNFFATRKCFVFPRPAGDRELKRLEKLTEAELEPEFLKQAQEFCSFVFSSAKPKAVTGGRTLTGNVLGSLADVYVEAIRSGKVPCLENAVEALTQIQNKQAVDQALQIYREQVCMSVCFPLDPLELSDIHKEAEKKAIDAFISISFNDCEQKAQMELMRQIQNEYEDLCAQNKDHCLLVCKEILKHVFTSLDEDLNGGFFMHPGGYLEYRDKLQSLTRQYRVKTHNKLMSEEVLNEYMKEQEKFERSILLADQSLSKAEKKEEERRLQNEALQQQQRALEKMNQLQEQMLRDQERTYSEHLNETLQRMDKEMNRSKEDNERVLEAKLKEQEALLKQGFQERADQMNKEIKSLRDEMKKDEESKPSTLQKVVDTAGMAASLFLPGIIPKAIGLGVSFLSRFLK